MQSEHLFTSWGGDLKWFREPGVTGVPQRFMGNKVCSTVFLGQSDCRNHSNYFMYVCLSATTFCPFKGAAVHAGAWQIKRVLFQMWWLYVPFSGAAIVLRCVWKPEKERWESQWGREWMCWCLEVNIQYPTLRVLHVWISLSEQSKAGTGRDRKGWSQRQETGRQKERLKALKLQPERLFQKNVSSPHSLPLNALTLIWDTEHLHLEKSKAEGGWICASATWSLDLPQICSQSVALTRLRDWSKFSNFCFLSLCFGCRLRIHGGNTHQTEVMLGTNAPLS